VSCADAIAGKLVKAKASVMRFFVMVLPEWWQAQARLNGNKPLGRGSTFFPASTLPRSVSAD
jgi:hypothetical protein